MMLVLCNLMVEVVLNAVDEVIKKESMCKCEQCKLDVAAIALNSLPPRYVVTAKGATYGKADLLELQKYIDVIGAVAKAVKLVKEHPRH